jgi:sec-independent protein translocase protein TatA
VFGGHLPELVILLVVALVIFGPKRLPEIGGAMGKGIKEFKKGTQELHDDGASQQLATPHSNVDARPVEKPVEAAASTRADRDNTAAS